MINIKNYKVEQDSRLPKLYKRAAEIAELVVDQGGSLKRLVFESEEKLIKPVYALVVETIKHLEVLDKIIKKSKLFKNLTSLQLWLSKILLTELLFRKRKLLGGSSWPVKYIREHQKQLEDFLSDNSNQERKVQKPRYVRVNTLKLTPDEAIKIFRNEGWVLIPSPSDYSEFLNIVENLQSEEFIRDFHIKDLLVFPKNTQFFNHELYSNGSILLQDKASCLATFLLNPERKSTVWDMCAAPGMKTTHLSAIMKNKGQIYATEIHTKRYDDLCKLVESAGCKNVTLLNLDAFLVHPNGEEPVPWCNDIDYILIDPSCSGSGMTDRLEIFSNEELDSNRLYKLCQFQFKLLTHALTNFPKVKRVVYSTCSLKPEENEMVIRDVLRNLSEPKEPQKSKKRKKKNKKQESLLQFKLVKPLEDSWPRRGSNEYEFGHCCLNSDPEKDLTNGFFIAVFERITDNNCENNKIEEPIEGKKKKKNKEVSENVADEISENDKIEEHVVKKKKKKKSKDVFES